MQHGSETCTSDVYERAIQGIYAAASEPERWPHMLQAVADCFDDIGGTLVY